MEMNSLVVTWAIPVDLATLAPRLEAYVDTRDTINALKSCAMDTRARNFLALLPQELVDMIALQIRESVFESRKKYWRQSLRCCAGQCKPSEHLDPREVSKLFSDYSKDDSYIHGDQQDHDFELWLVENDHGLVEHEREVPRFLQRLGEGNELAEHVSVFTKYMRVFYFSGSAI